MPASSLYLAVVEEMSGRQCFFTSSLISLKSSSFYSAASVVSSCLSILPTRKEAELVLLTLFLQHLAEQGMLVRPLLIFNE